MSYISSFVFGPSELMSLPRPSDWRQIFL